MIVEQGQSFWDMVIQGTGDIENAFARALLNGVSVTDDLPIGYEFKTGDVTNKRIQALFNPKHKPATFEAFPSTGDLSPVKGGIGYMQIEVDFIVS